MPKRHFIKVDFPAPFSPMSECTVPGRTRKVTASNACTPGNDLHIPFISKMYSTLASLPSACGAAGAGPSARPLGPIGAGLRGPAFTARCKFRRGS